MNLFIDGEFRPGCSAARREVRNPATGECVDSVVEADERDADLALQSAARGFEIWRKTPVAARARLQKAAAAAMRAEKAGLGALLTRELGRPLAAAIAEIERSAELLEVYAEEGLRVRAEMPLDGVAGQRAIVTHEPVGVVVAIAPFNYPITLLTFKLGAALMAGCTVVAKPAEDTPLSTLKLAELFSRVGYPKGCFNVVTGDGRGVGLALVRHEIPRKVAFTGGVGAGVAVASEAVRTMKRLTLELGGHSPAIVCAGADLDKAAAAISRHAFANSGQFCYRVNRVYVERPAYETFLARLTQETNRLVVGDPLSPGTALGPLVGARIYDNCVGQIADAREKGGRVLSGGARLTGGLYDRGYFLPPTLVADATSQMKLMREETFGPVLGIAAFDDPHEALRLANDTPYGLAGFVFSADLAKAWSLADRLEAGSVWVNDIQRSRQDLPFGGVKQSGLGREKGREGIEAYLETKTIYLSWSDPMA
jgi:succinate-semialdehyde dehydrogenase/glutarate-semialdehyde dehydrogenase